MNCIHNNSKVALEFEQDCCKSMKTVVVKGNVVSVTPVQCTDFVILTVQPFLISGREYPAC